MFEDIKKIKELIALLEDSKLKKLSIKKKDEEIFLEKEDSFSNSQPPITPKPDITSKVIEEETKEPLETEAEGKIVPSPMVGSFYAAPGPDQPAFVKVGDKVSAETVLCIIEAMKVMNEVKAGIDGVVDEIYVKNGQTIEYGTKLFRIK